MTQKTILITGASGAGASGIGATLVQHFSSHGFSVIGVDITASKDLLFEKPAHHFFTADLTDLSDIKALADQLISKKIKIDHIISNAGGALEAEFQYDTFIDDHVWDQSLQKNLSSHYYLIKHLHPLFRSGKSDKSITLISSINAIRTYGLIGYSAAKAGLSGLMLALCPLLGRDNIRINCLLPGTVKQNDDKSYNKDMSKLSTESCLGRNATGQDVADAAFTLCHLKHMTGAKIVLDGGQSIFKQQT